MLLAMRSVVQCNPGEGPQQSVRLQPLTRTAFAMRSDLSLQER